jgi:hypothetical protein
MTIRFVEEAQSEFLDAISTYEEARAALESFVISLLLTLLTMGIYHDNTDDICDSDVISD